VEQTSPLDEERAAKKAAAEAASGTPDPATVPEPPEQSPGQSSDDEAPIEQPIAPAGSRQDEPGEALATVTGPADGPSDGRALVIDDADQLQSLRVLFPEDGISIDAAAESELIGLAGYLNNYQAQRVVLHAHAGDSAQGSSHARRLSLSRALAIRTFLVDRGVPVDRIYLRPLGSEVEDGPPDRVDILPLRP
jgi:outer membrane protein OmpA-like peptidoglycan-associated protein